MPFFSAATPGLGEITHGQAVAMVILGYNSKGLIIICTIYLYHIH